MEGDPLLFPHPSSSYQVPHLRLQQAPIFTSIASHAEELHRPTTYGNLHHWGTIGTEDNGTTSAPAGSSSNLTGVPQIGASPSVLEGSNSNKRKEEKKVRRQKFAFRTRSQVDVLDDGYRWRKYGQKAVKNNRFPRSYYKCTHPRCDVKKQVQRQTEDEGVVVTTYEGVHMHEVQKPNESFDQILSQMRICANVQ